MDIIVNDVSGDIPHQATLIESQSQRSFFLNWLNCLGFDAQLPPMADFLAQYHGYAKKNWLVIEPIHWEASHNNATITASGAELLINEEEALQWFSIVAEFLKLDGLTLYYHTPSMWLLDATGKPNLTSHPTVQLLHHPLMPIIKALDSTSYWSKLLTELQMLLSNHPLNLKREDQLSINGLWIYGQGSFIIPSNITLTDDQRLIHCFPKQVKTLNLINPINKNDIILINDVSSIDFKELKSRIGRQASRWFWNNIAYQIDKKSWWNWSKE